MPANSNTVILSALVLVALAAVAAYSNSLRCPFIFDDQSDIVNNASIRHLWPIRNVFMVHYEGSSGLHSRPVVNFLLAINHAIGGLDPFAYHLTNLLVHVLAGLTLFGIVRRTLLLPSLGGRFSTSAISMAVAVALIWTLHPLQTGAVTYVTQRYESMMGLFYLLSLYAAVRCGTSTHPGSWAIAAVGAMLLALGCKEVAVSIPITILLYDRAFLAGSFREALRRRWKMYLGLAAAWACFAVLLLCSTGRSKWAGYALPVTWMQYAESQFGVLLHYLRLSVWPRPLVLDYAWPVARTLGDILPAAAVIGGLAAVTVYALIRWPKCGFLGAWFFLIFAPTSSVLPIADLAFEHRMYLALAAVVAALVMGAVVVGQWLVRRGNISRPTSRFLGGALALSAAIALGILTFQRNVDYQTALSIWTDTVANAPANERAWMNLGIAQAELGQSDEAMSRFEKALAINPIYAEAHFNLAKTLADRGQLDRAIDEYGKAAAIKPDYADAHMNLAAILVGQGHMNEALAHCQKALEISPNVANVHNNLGNALVRCGKFDEALRHFQKAVEIDPDYVSARNNLGLASTKQGQIDQAVAQFRKALEIKPDFAEAQDNLGVALAKGGRLDDAIVHFRQAVEIKPDFASAQKHLARALNQKQPAN